jgi:hypothetical protein
MAVTRDDARAAVVRMNARSVEGSKDCFTVPQLARELGESQLTMRKVCDQWLTEGAVERATFSVINGWGRRQVCVGYRFLPVKKGKK